MGYPSDEEFEEARRHRTPPRNRSTRRQKEVGAIDLEAMRALAKIAVRSPSLRWRRHGIGLIQAYLKEAHNASENEIRLHIWDPSIRRSDITDRGDIHNHRFDFESLILEGSLINSSAIETSVI